jgi:hypothetical protein
LSLNGGHLHDDLVFDSGSLIGDLGWQGGSLVGDLILDRRSLCGYLVLHRSNLILDVTRTRHNFGRFPCLFLDHARQVVLRTAPEREGIVEDTIAHLLGNTAAASGPAGMAVQETAAKVNNLTGIGAVLRSSSCMVIS